MKPYADFFYPILDDNENVLWYEKPKFLPFILQNIFILIFSIAFGAAFIFNMSGSQEIDTFMVMFLLVWFGIPIGRMIWSVLTYFNTYYALTDKRVIVRGGFLGIDYKSIDHDKVQEIIVDVNVLEKILDCGSIKLFLGDTSNKGERNYDTLIGVENPYDVYKLFKTTNMDIKTDISYPNALRPETNPGYGSKYDKK